MEAMRIVMDEHQSLAAILYAIRFMIQEIRSGALQPDYKLLQAMVRYLDAYPEKQHHPKENAFLFDLLKKRTDEGAAAIARLEEEHCHGDERIKALEAAVEAYAAGEEGGFEKFAEAFATFAEFYRNHMLLEEREILPLVKRHFTPEDWAMANAGFQANPDPMVGTRMIGTRDNFQQIFSRLVAAAPIPIGLGAGPYVDPE